MKNSWLSFTSIGLDGQTPYRWPLEFHVSEGSSLDKFSQFNSLVGSSFYHVSHIYVSGSLALQGAFSCISKFAGSVYVWLSTEFGFSLVRKIPNEPLGSTCGNLQSYLQTSIRQDLAALQFSFGSNNEHPVQEIFTKFGNSTIKWIWKEVEKKIHAGPSLLLAGALIPPFDTIPSSELTQSITMESAGEQMSGHLTQPHRANDHDGCTTLAASRLSWMGGDAVEPKTGIKFPTFLEDDFSLPKEVLVGIGSRSMRVVKLKSLKLYAFGLYVRPNSICEKLGPKYASVPECELKNRPDFLEDLLREDIDMTVRLVVHCNGLKINTVRDAFEKSLRTRLQKMNPTTNYHCLRLFGSYFTEDIALPVGTLIDFRQTADGRLITEIGGKHVGAVQSKDLCRAFFDMYIGNIPVSKQAKEEIAQNVAGLIARC